MQDNAEVFRAAASNELRRLGLNDNQFSAITQVDDRGRLHGDSTIAYERQAAKPFSASANPDELLSMLKQAASLDELEAACRARNLPS